ncbi:hypothetical protein PIB30_101879 [Stylosanthes scabra]|uniref:Putative plant transposon protein domain-containing protein n=1 Tax=Stylosanthes scabra TaxID=79078 RepID=A0ABU6QYN7_9FABA|nr:hypothetical protein [Stylosanthes scabra]
MADRKADRKRKGKAISSSSQVIPRFKTLYHEAHFNATLSARRILPELILQADENVFSPIRLQIHQRKWEKFTEPIQAVDHLMVKELYANAWELDKAKRKQYTYTSTVRETDVSFAPSNIKRVLKLRKDPIPDATSYHERKANKDYKLDHILEDMCEEGAEWVRHRDGRPHFLRRSDLESMTKGFYTHFDTSMSQVYRRLDQQQEENRRSFEAINTRMDIMDDQLSFLCYSNQMANEQMLSPYQDTARQFKEIEMQGIPVTMANLAIHRQRKEEINQERMRYNQILQEAAAQQAREANKGKTREVVPDSEDEFVLSESEEF